MMIFNSMYDCEIFGMFVLVFVVFIIDVFNCMFCDFMEL